ncbi:LEM3/CDC50 family protein [Pyronema omphalodes]|nr:LEM3/CDC50 family protein [Pyronema omphalodes]
MEALGSKKKDKNRKPGNTAFRQQRLQAWQPIITPKKVLPLFFIIGFVLVPIGGLLLYASSQVQELVIDYTHCDRATEVFTPIPEGSYNAVFKTVKSAETYYPPPEWKVVRDIASSDPKMQLTNPRYLEKHVCSLKFTIPNNLKPPVLLFYRLTNFYQNHRRYVQSLDEDQLRGEAVSLKRLLKEDNCAPLSGNGTLPYYPCGLIANSMFNDTFQAPLLLGGRDEEVVRRYNMTSLGTAWESDAQRYGQTEYTPDQVIPPPNWVERFENGRYTEETMPQLGKDEEFQVWMRAAGLPTFSKLALRNDREVMEAGEYRVNVFYRFPVREYRGTKSLVISTRTVMGGRNSFLGIAYCVVGGVCIMLGLLFTARTLIKPRKLGDHTLLSWNREELKADRADNGVENVENVNGAVVVSGREL